MAWYSKAEKERLGYKDVYGDIRNTDIYRDFLRSIEDAVASGDTEVVYSTYNSQNWYDIRECALCVNHDFGYNIKFKTNWRGSKNGCD